VNGYARPVSWPTDVETTGANSGLGAVVGVQRLSSADRLTLVAEVLFWVTLVAGFAVLSSRSGWLGVVAVAGGLIFAFTRGTSDAWIDSFPTRLRVSLSALAVLVVVGCVFPPSGGRAWVLAYVVPGLTAWALSIWHHLRREQAAWICCADGMLRTDGAGAPTDRFTWSQVSTVEYKCDLRSVPHAETREGYAWIAGDKFTLKLADGAEHKLDIPSGGPPDLVMHAGPPSPISTTIAERVSEAQLVAAQAQLDAGGSVQFGPLAVGRDGLGTTGGVLAWPEIEKVWVEQWALKFVYNPRTEDVPRFLRMFIQVRTEAAADGREPQPQRWDVHNVPDIATLQRVRVPEGEQPPPAEIDAADSQIPNFFTLLRLFDAYGKR